MMVNQLIMAIARAIRKEFQQEKIFTDSVEQGIETPCFFILCISQKEFAKLDVRFLAEHTFVISYLHIFPICLPESRGKGFPS